MRVECWALKNQQGFVKNHDNPFDGFKTRTFKTLKAAQEWAWKYPFYRAKPVKIILTVKIKDY